MLRWDDAQAIMYTLASESETAGRTFLDLMANQGYKTVLSEFNSEQIEEERETVTEADRRDYQLPVDALWLSQVIITNGTTKYPLVEVKSRDIWEGMTSNDITGIPEYYFFQPRKGIGGGSILLDPMPSDEYILTLFFETTGKSLSQAAYSAGTVTIDKDTLIVTGVGTTFTAAMIGRYIQFTDAGADNLWYKVVAVNSTTELELENYYQGEDYSSGNYQIAEMFELPEDLHMAPIYYALWHYFASRRNKEQSAIYQSQYKMMVKDAHERHNQKTRDNVIHNFDNVGSFGNDYPSHFPADGID